MSGFRSLPRLVWPCCLPLWATCLLVITPVSAEETPTAIQHRVLAADNGRVALIGTGGTVEWSIDCPTNAHDLQYLTNGHVLMPVSSTAIVEVTPTKEVVWKYESHPRAGYTGRVEVHAFERLSNGNTMIAESGNRRIIEVDASGLIVLEVPLTVEHPDPHRDTRMARKLANGNYLVCHEGDGAVREYDPQGTVVWSYKLDLAGRPRSDGHGPEGHGVEVYGAIRLSSGHTLIAGGNNNRVIEVNPAGEIVWSIDQRELPRIVLAWVTSLHALPNGNIIVGNCHAGEGQPQLFEVTREKQVVWEFYDFRTFGNGLAAAHVLDLPPETIR